MIFLEALQTDKNLAKDHPFFGCFYDEYHFDDCFYTYIEAYGKTFYHEYFWNSLHRRVERNPISQENFEKIVEKWGFKDKWYPLASGTYDNLGWNERHQISKEITQIFENMKNICQ